MTPDGLVVTGRFGEYLDELRETWPPRPDLYEKHVQHDASDRVEVLRFSTIQ